LIEAKSFKLAFLAGDKEAVMYNNPKEPLTSSYSTNQRGLQVGEDRKATILDN